ncbi:restriction endonuclease subunit S [Gemmobacter caeruleus]|uniref:restriction endonuclease subunit S n=1 Tax=Gemmobacter caeruleus TaxID=2595004 RepID=UPI0011EBE581|nr:restriction endonuclease subunit S [Gemmobacter caeruleus]
MNSFTTRKIGTLGRVVTGKTPSTANDDYFGGPYPFITIPDLDGRVVIDSSARTLSQTGAGAIKSSLLPAGSVMMSCIATVGKCGITARTSFTNQQINSVIPNEDVDAQFLYYAFREIGHVLERSGGGGSVYTNVSKSRFSDIELLVPPLPEQRAIAATLGALDDKIELNRKMNATLEAMARALFRDWFVDFGPTRAKMEARAPYLSPDLWSLFPNRLDAEGKPEGWEVRSVYDFANVVYGAPFASKQFNTDSAGIPLIRIRDLATHEPGVWTEEVHPKGHLIEPGDIVVGMDGEFRLHVWKGAPAWLNQRVCHFEPRPGVPTAFLAEALIEPLAFFERGKVGTTVIHLGKGDIDTFRLLHPGTELLSAFGEIARSLIDATVKNATESRTLAQTRDLLLPRLMSGELRVADINSEEAEHA